MRPIKKVIVHCSDSKFGDVSVIREWHKARGWNDIGYHYVVLNGHRKPKTAYMESEDGFIEAGRSMGLVGAHCEGHNTGSIGICLIGIDDFSPKQMDALYKQLAGFVRTFGLSTQDVLGHYELDGHGKTCPNMDMHMVRTQLVNYMARG